MKLDTLLGRMSPTTKFLLHTIYKGKEQSVGTFTSEELYFNNPTQRQEVVEGRQLIEKTVDYIHLDESYGLKVVVRSEHVYK